MLLIIHGMPLPVHEDISLVHRILGRILARAGTTRALLNHYVLFSNCGGKSDEVI